MNTVKRRALWRERRRRRDIGKTEEKEEEKEL